MRRLQDVGRTISGTVTDESGLPLPGVNVIIKGTSTGVQTDFDGNYTIEATRGDVLVFSYIGLATAEYGVGDNTIIDVILKPDAAQLEEVVITAVGITRDEKELGYNVQTVSSGEITSKPNSDVVNSLSGETSGVQIVSSSGEAGASTYMTIRGSSSLTGNNQPLFVINGMPVASGGGDSGVGGVTPSSRTIDINPQDIKSISVLKGGAATALYGVRAANGAVIITTKSGKNLEERRIEFHSTIAFDQVSQLPPRQDIFAQGQDGIYIGGNANSFGPRISTLEYDGDTDFKWDPFGRLVPEGTGNGMPARAYDAYEFFQTGITTNNMFSIANGSEKGNYYFSFSHLDQEGIMPNDTYDRTTLRLSSTTSISDDMTFGADMAYTNSGGNNLQKGSNVSGIMLGLLRGTTTFDNSAGYEFPDGTQRNYRYGSGYDNPYWVANNISNMEDVNRFTGSINYNWIVSDFFNINYNGGVDWYNRRVNDQFKIDSNAQSDGYYSEYQAYNTVINSDLLLNFEHDFSDDFNAQLTLGNNLYSTFFKSLFGDADGLEIPNFYQLSNSSSNTTSSSESSFRTMAVFADLRFSYQDLIFLGLTGRNDWSTTMPEQNQSAFYPSASLSFILTELEGLDNNDILTFAKLRGSAARTANIAEPYNTTNNFVPATVGDGWTSGVNFPYQGQTAFQLSTGLGNPDLTHENQESWEIGADLRFFQNRIGLDVTYFENTNTDLLMSVPISAASGFTSIFLNAASMESNGYEVSLRADIINTEKFNWSVISNFTKFDNVVTSLAEGVDNVFLGGFTVPQVRAVVGREYRSIFGFDWYRDEDGNVLINDDPTDNYRDGYPMADEREMVPIGNFNPDWTANITNTISYGSASLSFLIDIKKGGMMYNGTAFAMNYFGTHARTANREVVYTDAGTIDFDQTPAENIVVMDGVYGRIGPNGEPISTGVRNVTPVVEDQAWFRGMGSNFGGGPSVAAMEPTDWVRLRNITVSYDFEDLIQGVNNLRVYASGKNLWLSTPYTGIDPETNLGGASNAQGMDYFNSPGTKTVLMGIKLTL